MFLKYVNAMKYLEIIPDFLSMYGVLTSQSTSQIRQEMSIQLSTDFQFCAKLGTPVSTSATRKPVI